MRWCRFLTMVLGALVALSAVGGAGIADEGAEPGEAENAALAFCDDVTEIPQTECKALATLFVFTDGKFWRHNDGWGTTDTPCSWYGVACSDGHVSTVDLSSNRLGGTIPPALASLKGLRVLDLWNNSLQGRIPSELGSLTSLELLNLGDNELAGPIPPQLGNLVGLRSLGLYFNELRGQIPPELGSLVNLEHLDLRGNRLQGRIPSELGKLIKLQYLYLPDNRLSGLVPTCLGHLMDLRGLDLSGNELRGPMPNELCGLSNLQELRLDRNRLTGPIPLEIDNLSELRRLVLQGNCLSGQLPPQIANAAHLEWLDLSHNCLSGGIPVELGSLTKLRQLSLNHNQLGGHIPLELAHLKDLLLLDLGHNKLMTIEPSLAAFLNDKDPDWANTQTVPPTGVLVWPLSSTRAQLTWVPIAYTGGGGFYQVRYAHSSGGTPRIHGATPDKAAGGYVAESLLPGLPYYFMVWTVSPADGECHGALWSEPSAEVMVMPPPVVATVEPETGGQLVASMDVTTTLTFPGAAVWEPVDVTLSVTSTLPPANGHRYLGHAFSIEAHAGDGSPVTTFSQPFTITVQYEDADAAVLDEASLGAYGWDEGGWVWKAIETWLDAEANRLTATADQAGIYAAMGESQQVMLPLVPVGRRDDG